MGLTRAGLTAARARGRTGGRPKVKAFADPKKLALARQLYAEKQPPFLRLIVLQANTPGRAQRRLSVAGGAGALPVW